MENEEILEKAVKQKKPDEMETSLTNKAYAIASSGTVIFIAVLALVTIIMGLEDISSALMSVLFTYWGILYISQCILCKKGKWFLASGILFAIAGISELVVLILSLVFGW